MELQSYKRAARLYKGMNGAEGGVSRSSRGQGAAGRRKQERRSASSKLFSSASCCLGSKWVELQGVAGLPGALSSPPGSPTAWGQGAAAAASAGPACVCMRPATWNTAVHARARCLHSCSRRRSGACACRPRLAGLGSALRMWRPLLEAHARYLYSCGSVVSRSK